MYRNTSKMQKVKMLNCVKQLFFLFLAMDMHNSSTARNKEDLFTASTCVLLDTLEFVCKILVLVFLSFMIMFLSITVCLLVLGGMFLGIAYLLCGLKYLCKFLCYAIIQKTLLKNDMIVLQKHRLLNLGYKKLVETNYLVNL